MTAEDLVRWRDTFMATVDSPWYVERLFDSLPDIVFSLKDRQGRYVSIGATAAMRCGLKHRNDAVGQTAFDLFPKPMAERYTRQDEHVFRTGQPIVDSLDLTVYRDGSAGWCLTTKEPLYDKHGNIIGLACVSKDLTEPSRAGFIDNALAETVDFLLDHIDVPLRIDALAQRAGLSQAQFDRRMKKIFQLSAGQYLMKARIDHATRLLGGGDLPIVEIAQQCGFSDQSAFSRQFRHVTGFTPRQYRQLLQAVEKD